MNIIHQHALTSRISQIQLVLPRTGYCLDPNSLDGLTRVTLRMLEQGAGGMDAQTFNAQLEKLGANIGHTLANDHIRVFLSVLTENIEVAIEMFAKALFQPNFTQQCLTQLKQELISTWITERQQSKHLRAIEVLFVNLHKGGPQGKSADGNPTGINNITLENVQSQYKKIFVSPKAFFAIVSNLPKKQLETMLEPLEKFIATSKPTPFTHPWDEYNPLTPPGRRVTIVPEANTNTDEILLSRFAANESKNDWYIQQLANFILGGSMFSRLFHEIRGKRGYSYGASASQDNRSGKTPRNVNAPIIIYTFPSADKTIKALPLALKIYEDWAQKGITQEELDLASKSLIQSYPFQNNTPHKQLGWQIIQQLYGIQITPKDKYQQQLEDLTTKDVFKAVQAVHNTSDLEIVLLGDQKRLNKVVDSIHTITEVRTVKYPEETTIAA